MNKIQETIFEHIAETLDIPESAYEKAEARYRSLGDWFGRPEARCSSFSPHISSQGSFRLGTVVRSDEYDLDFTCKLRDGVSRGTHSQAELKRLVGLDMAAYREAHGIKEELEAMHRCWRLKYADTLAFHMDVVPAIPHDQDTQRGLRESMVKLSAFDETLAQYVAEHACAITDDRKPTFRQISPDWLISNPEGYAIWFGSRVRLARIELGDARIGAAEVDDLPDNRGTSPLQLCVKILKRHRDLMFVNSEETKPVSIIITTLAARAYSGEADVARAIENCLRTMENLVRDENYHVRNPVNPAEDFADKWRDPAYAHLQLAKNFQSWVRQARSDFEILGQQRDPEILALVGGRFGGRLDPLRLRQELGRGDQPRSPAYSIKDPSPPWSRSAR